jgi:hypothetical protein
VALHGEQGIDLAFQAADGEEQFFVVGGGHGCTVLGLSSNDNAGNI